MRESSLRPPRYPTLVTLKEVWYEATLTRHIGAIPPRENGEPGVQNVRCTTSGSIVPGGDRRALHEVTQRCSPRPTKYLRAGRQGAG